MTDKPFKKFTKTNVNTCLAAGFSDVRVAADGLVCEFAGLQIYSVVLNPEGLAVIRIGTDQVVHVHNQDGWAIGCFRTVREFAAITMGDISRRERDFFYNQLKQHVNSLTCLLRNAPDGSLTY